MFRGDRLKLIREQMGLSQEAFGALFHISKVTICGYENGTRTPKMKHFLEMLDILEVSPDYLLGRDAMVVEETTPSYTMMVSKEDLQLLKSLEKFPKLAYRLRTDTERTLRQADQLLKGLENE